MDSRNVAQSRSIGTNPTVRIPPLAYTHLINVSARDTAIAQLCPEIILVKVLERAAVVVTLRVHSTDKRNAAINHMLCPGV